MEQRIGKGVGMSEIRRPAEQMSQRMIFRQTVQRPAKIQQFLI
jgi:hypothetical protein